MFLPHKISNEKNLFILSLSAPGKDWKSLIDRKESAAFSVSFVQIYLVDFIWAASKEKLFKVCLVLLPFKNPF